MIEVIKLILSDWKRYTEIHKKVNPFLFIAIYINNPGMFFSVIYRIEHYLITNKYSLRIGTAIYLSSRSIFYPLEGNLYSNLCFVYITEPREPISSAH